MHSTQYQRLAQAADSFFTSIVAMVAMPAEQGTYPSAWCILVDDSKPAERAFSVSMGVLPVEPGREAFFTSSYHGVSQQRAAELFAQKLAANAELGRIGEVEDNKILQLRRATA